MAEKRLDIVELRSDNYSRWRNDLQVALIIAQCAEVVEFAARPDTISEEDWAKWSKNATAIILKALRDDYWRATAQDTPFEIVRKIQAAFQPTSSLIAVMKICKLFSLSNGVESTSDIVKEITSAYAEAHRSIQASDALRDNVIIHESIRTAILAFAVEKLEPAASQQIKEKFERNDISFEQAVSLLAEVRVTHRGSFPGGPTIAMVERKRTCTFCNGSHEVDKCWFKDPSLAPERLRSKICKTCKRVGHATKDCNSSQKGNANLLNGEAERPSFTYGLTHHVNNASCSSATTPVILDSGCTIHMMSSKGMFSTYSDGVPDSTSTVYTASGQPLPVVGHGTVCFRISNVRAGTEHDLEITKVLHVPDLKENILSVAALDLKGINITTANQKMILRDNGKFLASAYLSPSSTQYQLVYANKM